MPETPIVYASETGQVGGVQVKRGEVWAADDPLVVRFPGAFTAEPYRIRRSGPAPATDPLASPAEDERPIERGTRRPGERRRIGRGGRAVEPREGQPMREGTPSAGPAAPEGGVAW